MCLDPLVIQVLHLALMMLATGIVGSTLYYGITVEMVGKSDYDWRNWHSVAIFAVLTCSGVALSIQTAAGIIRTLE